LNRVQDGAETDVDCGGSNPNCARCPDGRLCLADSDCAATDLCGAAKVCVSRAAVSAGSFYVQTSLSVLGSVAVGDFAGSAQDAVAAAVLAELEFRGVLVRGRATVVVVGVRAVGAAPASGRLLGGTSGAAVDVAIVASSASTLASVPDVVRCVCVCVPVLSLSLSLC
jgi:hypothetical protein